MSKVAAAVTNPPTSRELHAAATPRALLAVDFENICRALGDAPFHFTKGAAREQAVAISTKMRLLTEEAGYEVHRVTAFADWDAMPRGSQRALALAGIEPAYVAGLRGKSSTDIELSLDVLEVVLSDESISHVVIAGGDRDYLPIVRRLRRIGCSVTIAALSPCIGNDLKAFVTSWPGGAVLELDSWVAPESGASDTGESGIIDSGEPELTSDEAPPTEPSAAVPVTVAPDLTDAQLSLLNAMQNFMFDRGVREIHLAPFFRHLHDNSHFGPQHGVHPRTAFEELKAAGLVEVERRAARGGGDFAVATLRQDGFLVGTAGLQDALRRQL